MSADGPRKRSGKRHATLGSFRVTARRPERKKPVLIVQHAPYEHPAAVRRALESQGIPTLTVHPYLGERYPKSAEISGLISLGGPMGANDDQDHHWISAECRLIQDVVRAMLPTVGICLGGQLIARALGGKVEKHRVAEIGWFPVFLNEQGISDPVVGAAGAEPTVYHWHADTFHPPDEATLLATSKACERQAYRIGETVYGFQFHPEADHQLVLEWLEHEDVEIELRNAQSVHGHDTVQDAETQRFHATKGEKGSLKITAAIASLFRRRAYEPVGREFREKLPDWASHRTPLILEFLSPERKLLQLRGIISATLSIPTGEYVIFQEENTLLWPVRLDDIARLEPIRT